jgi:hypothetical protein
MAKPLRIGSMIDVDQSVPGTVAQLERLADAGFDHAFAAQIFGHDALTLLATIGRKSPALASAPVWSRSTRAIP